MAKANQNDPKEGLNGATAAVRSVPLQAVIPKAPPPLLNKALTKRKRKFLRPPPTLYRLSIEDMRRGGRTQGKANWANVPLEERIRRMKKVRSCITPEQSRKAWLKSFETQKKKRESFHTAINLLEQVLGLKNQTDWDPRDLNHKMLLRICNDIESYLRKYHHK